MELVFHGQGHTSRKSVPSSGTSKPGRNSMYWVARKDSPFIHIVVSKKLNSSCQSKTQCGSVAGVCPKIGRAKNRIIISKYDFFIA